MLRIGLTSVTFRQSSASEVIRYCRDCGISAIEWGSDVHVPVGDVLNAEQIKKECKTAGISISSYGTYYRCGTYEDGAKEFAKYIEIARILEAPTLRVWIGNRNFEDGDEEYIESIVSELQMLCDLAGKENMEIAGEFHGGTLCNTGKSALEMVERVNRDNFGMYFQYDWNVSLEHNCENLKSFLPILKNVHVFHYDNNGRHSLGEGDGEYIWRKFIEILEHNDVNTALLFEFLPDQTVKCLEQEVEILKKMINK